MSSRRRTSSDPQDVQVTGTLPAADDAQEGPEPGTPAPKEPDQVLAPGYAELAANVRELVAGWARGLAPTSRRQRAKVEARAIKAVVRVLQDRLAKL